MSEVQVVCAECGKRTEIAEEPVVVWPGPSGGLLCQQCHLSRRPQASRRNPRGLGRVRSWLSNGGTASLGAFLLSGCATWEAVGAFFSGAGKAVVDAAPEITEDALSGNWLPAAVGLGVTAIVGGALEAKRRRRKRRLAAERNPA